MSFSSWFARGVVACLLSAPVVGCDSTEVKPDAPTTKSPSSDSGGEKAGRKPKRGERNRKQRPTKPARDKLTGKDKQKRGPQRNANAKADDGSTYTIKLRFHLLKSDEAEIVNTTIDRAGVLKLVDDVNSVWKAAKINFELESVIEVQAENAAAYQTLADKWKKTSKADRKDLKKEKNRLMRSTMTKANRIPTGIDIYMHRYMLGLGGVWGCPARNVVYAERKGGAKRPMASGTVLAHEIGHGLGLPHAPCKKGGNLMMEPCEHRAPDAFSLTEDQIAAARSWASTGAPRVCKRGERDVDD